MKHGSAKDILEEYQAQLGLIKDLTEEIVHRVVGACKTAYTRVAKSCNTLCPINALPVEILGYIFRLAGDYGAKRTTNLRLSMTCSRWRAVQLNNPSAWSSCSKSLTGHETGQAVREARALVDWSCCSGMGSAQPRSQRTKAEHAGRW